MSTVHTATSAASQGRRINALSSRHDSSDLTSDIFTGASIYWNGAGGERADSICIRLQVRRVLQFVNTRGRQNTLNGRSWVWPISVFCVNLVFPRWRSYGIHKLKFWYTKQTSSHILAPRSQYYFGSYFFLGKKPQTNSALANYLLANSFYSIFFLFVRNWGLVLLFGNVHFTYPGAD